METETTLKKAIKDILHAMDEEDVWNADEKLVIVKQFTEFYHMYKTIIQEYGLIEQPDFQTVIDLLFYLNTEYGTFTETPIPYDVCCVSYNNILDKLRTNNSHTLTNDVLFTFLTVEAFSRLKWYQLVLVLEP